MSHIFETEHCEAQLGLPVQITIDWCYDECVHADDVGWLGRLTLHKPYDGAVRVEVPYAMRHNLFARMADGAYPRYAYWDLDSEYGGGPEFLADLMHYRRGQGMSKHDAWVDARRAVRQQAEHLLSYYRDEWQFAGCRVTARLCGLAGHAATWGIEYGMHTEAETAHRAQIADELVEEAVADLESRIAKIIEVIGAVA